MSREGVELRDLLIQTLELNGYLPKIRAELRAKVFKTLNEDPKASKDLINDKLKTYCEKSEGLAMFYLVKDFLEFFNLNCTLSVFEQESLMQDVSKEKQQEILQKFKMNSDEGPLLLNLIKNKTILSDTPNRLNRTYEVNSPAVLTENLRNASEDENSQKSSVLNLEEQSSITYDESVGGGSDEISEKSSEQN